jgi:hypothetical protein
MPRLGKNNAILAVDGEFSLEYVKCRNEKLKSSYV